MRSIQELRAEEARIRAILDNGGDAELRAIPGVVHVSVGLKQVNGTATEEFCIRVYVAAKKELATLSPNERVPRTFRGVPTDVNEVEIVDPHVDQAQYRPITGGIQITNGVVNAGGTIDVGTLGCLATDNTDAKTVLVTNFHVIGGTAGTSVFQPLNAATDLIGVVKRGQISGTIDAAIADINVGIVTTRDEINGLFLNSSNHIAGVTDPVSGMRVFKVGRTTGLTSGKVVDPDAVTIVAYPAPIGNKTLTKAILIQSTKVSGCCCCKCDVVDGSKSFSAPGDSGSAVVSEQRMAVGLLMAGNASQTYACRMSEVESGMNVTINRTVVLAGPASLPIPGIVARASGGAPIDPLAALEIPTTGDDETVWSMMQRRLDEIPLGRELGVQVRHHVPEIVELVNHHRAVMVAWQRVQGPSFLAQWMNGVRHPSLTLPKEIDGVTMNSALLRMAAVLKAHGSTSLQMAVDSYGLDLMAAVDRSATVDEFIENLGTPVLA